MQVQNHAGKLTHFSSTQLKFMLDMFFFYIFLSTFLYFKNMRLCRCSRSHKRRNLPQKHHLNLLTALQKKKKEIETLGKTLVGKTTW